MQIILTDDIANLGRRGEVIRVAAGYGRNYLIPKGLALPANDGNLRLIEEQKVSASKKEAKFKEEAEVLATDLTKHHVVISRKAGDTGVLFGSVTSKDIAEAMASGGYQIDRRKISLEHPLKSIGNHTVEIVLHREVKVLLLVSVAPEAGESIARILHKGEESDNIFEDIEARVKTIRIAQGATASEPELTSAPPGNA